MTIELIDPTDGGVMEVNVSAEHKPPQHAFEIAIKIGANEADYVAEALREIAETIERSGIAGACSGGWQGSWSIDVRKREVTSDQYRDELERWRQTR